MAEGASRKHAAALGAQAEAQVMSNYQAVKAPGIMKQIISSIFSWQSLLIVGISLLVMYNKEITAWIGSLFKGKGAMEGLQKATEDFNAAKKEANKNAAKELVDAEMLYRIIKDETVARKDRLAASKELQEMYPQIFGNMSKEKMMVGDTTKEYNLLKEAIYSAAMAEAVKNKITEAQSKFLDDEQDRLDRIGQRKIQLEKLKNSPQKKEIMNTQGVITQFGTKGEIREQEYYLKQDRINREKAIKQHEAYLDKMYRIGEKYQTKANKKDNPKKEEEPQKTKKYTGSKLSGEEKDAIDLAIADRDNQIAKIKEQKINLEITEKEYWESYIKIQLKYRDRILTIINDDNAKKKIITANTRKKPLS